MMWCHMLWLGSVLKKYWPIENNWKKLRLQKLLISKISQIYPRLRYVDELQKYKADRIMNILGECRTIKQIKIIADTIWIHYAYLRRFINVKPKNQKEAPHENLTSCKNLDRLPRYQFEKKTPSVPTGG